LLWKDRYVPISTYSRSIGQKILLSAALLHSPKLLLLDRPFSGLDVNSALILRSLIVELPREGKAALFTSHELEKIERVCSSVIILHNGRAVASDSISQLRKLMSIPTPLEEILTQLVV
jgi:ABC-2 type transport system ATP-binding protein